MIDGLADNPSQVPSVVHHEQAREHSGYQKDCACIFPLQGVKQAPITGDPEVTTNGTKSKGNVVQAQGTLWTMKVSVRGHTTEKAVSYMSSAAMFSVSD